MMLTRGLLLADSTGVGPAELGLAASTRTQKHNQRVQQPLGGQQWCTSGNTAQRRRSPSLQGLNRCVHVALRDMVGLAVLGYCLDSILKTFSKLNGSVNSPALPEKGLEMAMEQPSNYRGRCS